LTLAVVSAAPALAQEPVGCDKFKWPVDKETAALRAPNLAHAEPAAHLTVPFAVALTLVPTALAVLPKAPERAPKRDTFAGYVTVGGVASGVYTVALSAGAWADLVQNGEYIKPKAFSGAQGCGGIRKVLQFDLTDAPFDLEISGAPDDKINIAVMPRK
jgi:hypothetical protein